MIHYLESDSSKLRYSDQGTGEILIILHGYLEAIETFKKFAQDLSVHSRVVCIDLPGHGESTIKIDHVGMNTMADAVHAVIFGLGLGKVHLIGHSMGGYVALAFADKYADKLMSFTLLHSTANADTNEKRANRKKEIEFIKKGKKDLICSMAVPNTFSKRNQVSFKSEIEELTEVASKTPDDGIVVALNAMMNRSDKNEVLHSLKVPKYSFIGKEDNYIPFDKGMAWANDNGMKAFVFEHSGHMSFVEEREKCVEAIKEIISQV